MTTTEFRVRYAETDQMGVAHHANHLVWCEQARTDHMRGLGVSYRGIEAAGLMLPVIDARVRYRAPARYEDLIRVRCWVREITRRQVVFGYVVERADDSVVLATAQTALVAVDSSRKLAAIPEHIRRKLVPVADPVRL